MQSILVALQVWENLMNRKSITEYDWGRDLMSSEFSNKNKTKINKNVIGISLKSSTDLHIAGY